MYEPTTVVPNFAGPQQIPAQRHPEFAPGTPPFGSPPFGNGGYPPPQWTPPAPPPRRRRTGLVVAVVLGALVLLGAIGAAAVFLLAPQRLDVDDVRGEIVRVTQEEVGIVPVDVVCPETIDVVVGASTTCTATLDGQPLSYTVRQNDDQGNLTIFHDRTLLVAELESAASALLSTDVGEEVVVACTPEEQTVLVNAVGAPISCGAANVADPSLTAQVTLTVDEAGTIAYEIL
ncbi:hypothetical protein GCM10017691_33940 [Pseudonocardia petroleophila]|uniref:DUF4333 domain-containing protein n=1 Tax=Pseudonocardia petroleophila TaxID=37331 RepID=A0A7G7MDF4_9PSEU|nr:DUF4333 domain-containing protein [Pseudonocardia petroleophila]QNG50815.1 DUF4333 domain-containing protein [Pseudonocardia petroleophila]